MQGCEDQSERRVEREGESFNHNLLVYYAFITFEKQILIFKFIQMWEEEAKKDAC